MRIIVIFFLFSLIIISCRTVQKEDLDKSYQKYEETTEINQKEIILESLHKDKNKIPDNLKESYIQFLEETIDDTPKAREYLIDLYKTPAYQVYQSSIIESLATDVENPETKNFIKTEITKNPSLYNQQIKQKLLNEQNEEAAEVLLDLIYLGIEKLDPEIIDLFKKTKYEESLPVLVESIEKQQYVEESFLAISEFQIDEAKKVLIDASTDPQSPNRDIAISLLPKIGETEKVYNIYQEVLQNPETPDSTKNIIIQNISSVIPELNQEQKKDLKETLEKLTLNPNLDESIQEAGILALLKEENQGTQEEPTAKKDNIATVIPLKQKEEKRKEPLKNNKRKGFEAKTTKRETKINKEKQETLPKDKVFYSEAYGKFLNEKFKSLLGEEAKETQMKIQNALITYSDSESDSAKLILSAYKEIYGIQDEQEIRKILKDGLFVKNSLYNIIRYIKNQYQRKDLQIYAMQRLFAIKRKHAEILIENDKQLKL
ncbi:MAG: hypothetical protein NZ853_05260 [Leptospiraceae bacterium]|nr:hypothetical protein [Leptospiraceae bacterium]MDW7976644.1 hypothetical protein [Leptospiraceae bacterium]